MPSYAYLDASAIVKLAVIEAETAALENDAASRDGLLSSRLGASGWAADYCLQPRIRQLPETNSPPRQPSGVT
jgi:hypothetical protein